MPPSLHAVLGASSAHRWLVCTPSARLAEKFDLRYGRKESEYAREGTKAHALGELKIRRAIYEADGMTVAKHSRMSKAEQDAYQGINEHRYTALRDALGDIPKDMEEATDSYCDVVMSKFLQARDADPGTQLLLEQRLDYSRWVPSGFGTGDCVIVSDRLLEVLDYKHGKGIPVDAVDNPQLRLYGLGAYDRFRPLFDFDAVRVTIIQPRLESVTEETLSVEDLLAWAESAVVERAKLAWAGTGEFVPGEHCRFCSAKAVCSARVAQGLKVFEYGLESPGMISDEQLVAILPYLDDAAAWIEDIKAYAENQALHGQRIPGYKLVRGKKPNRVWSNTEEVEAALLRAGYPESAFRETRLKSVGQVEKTLGKVAFDAICGPLTSQGEGKLILVPESDKRLEYTNTAAVFADMTETDATTGD
jgi:hypothetical protein